jgi:hypothetical protein
MDSLPAHEIIMYWIAGSLDIIDIIDITQIVLCQVMLLLSGVNSRWSLTP